MGTGSRAGDNWGGTWREPYHVCRENLSTLIIGVLGLSGLNLSSGSHILINCHPPGHSLVLAGISLEILILLRESVCPGAFVCLRYPSRFLSPWCLSAGHLSVLGSGSPPISGGAVLPTVPDGEAPGF